MAMNVFTNVSSLNAQRNVAKSSNNLATSFQRLSSGLRINGAHDDAAGLAISERMDAKVRGFDQARRNAADGVSLVQTAEGGMGEISGILQRLRELAVQSANDSNNASDRTSLDNEAKQLISSLDQIASSTDFNGKKILDGTVSSLTFQTGADNALDNRVQVDLTGVKAAQLGALAKSTGSAAVSASAAAANSITINSVNVGDATVFANEVKHSAVAGSLNAQTSSAYAKAKAINAANTGAKASAEETATAVRTFGAGPVTFATGLSVNGVDIIANGTVVADVNDLTARINGRTGETGVRAEIVDSTTGTFQLKAADGRNINVATTTDGVVNSGGFVGATDGNVRSNVTLSSESAISISAGASLIGFGGVPTASVGVDSQDLTSKVVLTSRAGSLEAIDRIDSAISKVLSSRAKMGALQSRLEATSSNLANVSENLSAARSRIRDADFASETAMLTRNQILQQAASAMLAQANQNPQQALQLLR